MSMGRVPGAWSAVQAPTPSDRVIQILRIIVKSPSFIHQVEQVQLIAANRCRGFIDGGGGTSSLVSRGWRESEPSPGSLSNRSIHRRERQPRVLEMRTRDR